MKPLKIGYMALSKASWRTPKIDAIVEKTAENLKKLPCEVVVPESLVTTEAEIIQISERFNREGVDAVVMHFVTFPAGALIPAAGSRLNVPIVLLANPEKPGEGKMWEQNSFCGANLGGFVMNRLRKRYAFVRALPENTAEAVAPFLRVVRCIAEMKELRIGLAGGRVPGFYTSNFDEMKLRREFGTTVEVLELLEIVNTAQNLPEERLAKAREIVKKSSSSVCCVGEGDLKLAAKMLGGFFAMADKYALNSFAVRCWPEFSDIFGIAPCAVLGMLSDNGLPTSCEGDVPGAVTMMILQKLAGGGIPFFVDLISYDEEANTGVVWHCGAAPVSLCRKFEETQYRLHMRVDGGDKKGVTNDFSLKAGRVTLAKLDQDVDGNYRMLIAPGSAIDTEPFLRGNPLTIRFDDSVPKLIRTILREGFEHHYSVIHADVKVELLQLCEWMKIRPVVAE